MVAYFVYYLVSQTIKKLPQTKKFRQ